MAPSPHQHAAKFWFMCAVLGKTESVRTPKWWGEGQRGGEEGVGQRKGEVGWGQRRGGRGWWEGQRRLCLAQAEVRS